MVRIEDTIDVPADTYSHALPDDYSQSESTGESQETGVSEDYDEDTVEIGITAFGDKLYLKFPRFDRRGTNDFCMSAMSIFTATVEVRDRRRSDLKVKPVLRKMTVLREREKDFVHGDPDDVTVTHLGDKSDMDRAHLQLIEEFTTTIAGFQEDEYWNGYKKAANVHGDDRFTWDDVAWKCFEERWSGNKELLADVGKWFAREGIAVCSRSKAFFPAPEWSTPTGSYVATTSDVHAGKCPNCGTDKDEHWECYSSSNRTRVPNKYKCTECGYKKSGITTG